MYTLHECMCVCVPFKVMFSVIQSVKIYTLHTAEISYEQKKIRRGDV